MRIPRPLLALHAAPAILVAACTSAPPYQGLQPDEIFQIASREYDEGDWDNSIRALDRLLVAHGDWPRIPEARLLLGHARYGNGEFLPHTGHGIRNLKRSRSR